MATTFINKDFKNKNKIICESGASPRTTHFTERYPAHTVDFKWRIHARKTLQAEHMGHSLPENVKRFHLPHLLQILKKTVTAENRVPLPQSRTTQHRGKAAWPWPGWSTIFRYSQCNRDHVLGKGIKEKNITSSGWSGRGCYFCFEFFRWNLDWGDVFMGWAMNKVVMVGILRGTIEEDK